MKRTTHRSSKGKKLYAVRDAEGRFEDIQRYSRAHRRDLATRSKPELSWRRWAYLGEDGDIGVLNEGSTRADVARNLPAGVKLIRVVVINETALAAHRRKVKPKGKVRR